MLCNDAEDHPQVDLASRRRLGARSILAAPLRQFHKTLGIFAVLSAAPNAFSQQDAATLQMLSSMMVAAIARIPPVDRYLSHGNYYFSWFALVGDEACGWGKM